MNQITKFILKNIKMLLLVNFSVTILCYLYCSPVEDTFELLMGMVGATLFFMLPIPFTKFANFIGTTEVFSKIFGIRKLYIYGYYNISGICFLVGIIGVVFAFLRRDFERSFLLLPATIGLYTAAKSAIMIQDYIGEIEK